MSARITVAALFALGVLVGLGALLLRASRSEDDARQEARLAEMATRLGLLEKTLQDLDRPVDRAARARERTASAPGSEGDEDPQAPAEAGEEAEESAAIRAELAALGE